LSIKYPLIESEVLEGKILEDIGLDVSMNEKHNAMTIG